MVILGYILKGAKHFVVLTEEQDVMVKSEEIIGTTEYLMLLVEVSHTPMYL
jgi:hypothetical protein